METNVYYNFDTTNLSFLSVQRELAKQGIENNKFMLTLYDQSLQGLDPYNPTLTDEEKAKVIAECSINIWYFFREVVRVPIQGGGCNRFTLDLSSCAQIYLTAKRKNSWVTKSRMLFKTTLCQLLCIYVGIFPTLALRYKKERISIYTFNKRDRIHHEKVLIDLLPDYMRLINVNTYSISVPKIGWESERQYIVSDNIKIPTFVYLCEAEYIDNVDQLYKDILNLQKSDPNTLELYRTNYPYMSIIAEGTICDETRAVELINHSIRWDNDFYDLSDEELDNRSKIYDETELFHIDFEYYELGYNQDWYNRMVSVLNHDPDIVRREIDCKRKK